MTPSSLDALAALLAAATRGNRADIVIFEHHILLAAPALIEAARREAAARFVAEYWRGEYMEGIEAGDSKWAIGTHPLAMVLAALDGETDPRQLGLPETADDAFRSILLEGAVRAALPAEGTE